MKRFLALAALVLGLASCQTEPEGLDVNVGGAVDTFVTVAIPDVDTRANSAESGIKNLVIAADSEINYTIRYIFEVYYGDNGVQKQVYYTDGQSASFPVRLVPGRDYNFVAWADIVAEPAAEMMNKALPYDCNTTDVHYDTTNLNAITLLGEWNAMDETRDAYTGFYNTADYENNKYTGSSSINIQMTRPFAKLRVITTDMVELNNLGIRPVSANVRYSAFSHESFNALDGTYSDTAVEKTHTYTIADYADQTGANKVLFTDYFFADDNDIVKFQLDVFEKGVTEQNETTRIKLNDFNTDIPVKRNYLTTISGNILTDGNNVNVTVDPAFDGAYVKVEEAAYAQSELDNAIANTTIYLEPGVDYGTLYLRPVAGASNTITDCDYLVYNNEMLRKVENLTIVGAPGATVDAIKVVAGYVENSGSTGYVVDIKNLTIDGVEFNDTYTNTPHSYAAPIFFDLTYTNVDGLTVKNCKLEGDNAKMNFVYLYGSGNPSNSTFETAAKNIVIENNTVDGIARLCELRQAENVTISNNTIKNTALHGILLSVDNGTYSGNVTITDNYAEGINERFVRMAGAGDAVVVIKDNLIKGYKGADEDFIKVTDGTNVTIENNYVVNSTIDNYDAFIAEISDDTWYDATKTELTIEDVADFAAFIETANSGNDFEGKTIKLTGDIDLYFKDVTNMADSDPTTFRPIGDTQYGQEPFKGTFDGQGHTIKNLYQNGWDLGYDWYNYGSYGLFGSLEDATIKNVVIEGSESYIEGGDVSFIAGSATGDCVFENITINSGVAATYNNGCGGIIGWSGAGNYTFKDITIGEDVVLGGLWGSFDSSIGGVVGQAEPGATYNFENVTINCRIDAYNDCTASYDYYNYRMCGMIIGRCKETTTIDGKNYPDLSKYNMTFNNVVVNYGDWMNYHYCRKSGERAVRVEPGYAYGGALDRDHSGDNAHCMECIPFDQLIGGDQYAVKGLREVNGVTVNYPASYRREVATATALTEALNDGLSVVLESDIDFGSTQLAITGENQVVDLGGHALTTANNWGGISLKNGATIKNGTITHAGNTAAIKAFNGSSIENVTINATCSTADKTVTGIAVQQGANVESIKNVTITGVSQGIEVGYQATVDLIENAVINESNNGTAKGIALVINGGKVGQAKDCTFNGETYGVTMHLKGVFNVALDLVNCEVKGGEYDLYAWDEKGISNTSGTFRLTYDNATEQKSGSNFIHADFEEECKDVVRIFKK